MTGGKQGGADFWDSNPCGGAWHSYRAYLDWYRRTEPYIFAILDSYEWTGKVVIEVGCGQGPMLNYLLQFGARGIGLDMSLQSLHRASAGASELGHAEQVLFSRGDAENLPFPDHTCDVAISVGVLHHTPDTAAGIREIYRVLRPGGRAVIMLYRSGNPKWWMTHLVRRTSRLVDKVIGHPGSLTGLLRMRQQPDNPTGTALMELFGVPVLKAFSNEQARHMFSAFSAVCITNYQAGFRRLADIAPVLRPFEPTLQWVDRTMQHTWGFYQVIEAQK